MGLAIELGGTITGEHGVGSLKRDWLAREIGPLALSLHRSIKAVFDPDNILNPGKVFTPGNPPGCPPVR
jgi:glycolate oxidase